MRDLDVIRVRQRAEQCAAKVLLSARNLDALKQKGYRIGIPLYGQTGFVHIVHLRPENVGSGETFPALCGAPVKAHRVDRVDSLCVHCANRADAALKCEKMEFK